ncbi:response regulator [candidate division WOR-3 bacterium]|nr:response regulator [candidate division WOR-3 bacterium]
MKKKKNTLIFTAVFLFFSALGVICFFSSIAAIFISSAMRLSAFIIAIIVMKRKWNIALFILSLIFPFSAFFILQDYFTKKGFYEVYYLNEQIRQASVYAVSAFMLLGAVYVKKFYGRVLKMNDYEKKLSDELKTYEAIFQIIPEMIFVIDRKGYFHDVISNNEEDLYVSREMIVGKNLKELLPKEVALKSLEAVRETLKTGANVVFEYDLEIKGEKRYFAASHVKLSEEKILGTVKNITDYIAVNKSLAQSEEKYRFFVRESGDGIMRFDSQVPISVDLPEDEQIRIFYENAVLAECNDAYARMYGFRKASEMIGKKPEEFMKPDDPENISYFRKFISSGYRLKDEKTVEKDSLGKRKIFSNSLIGNVADLKISHVWGIQRDITAETIAEEKIKEEKELMGKILSSLEIGLTMYDRDMRVLWVNEFIKKMFPFGDPVGKKCHDHFVGKPAVCEKCPVADTFRTEKNQNEVRFSKTIERWYNSRTFVVPNEQRTDFQVLEAIVDVTDAVKNDENKSKIEQQMLQAQKLESLGVLAGGIAHDFNNLLMGIMGNADLLLSRLKEGTSEKSHVFEILQASKNASELTHQLLSYSGKGKLEIEEIDVNEMIREMAPILQMSVSKKATIKYKLTQDIPSVSGDASQIRQVVMNLVINASESLSDKHGLIIVKTNALKGFVPEIGEDMIGELVEEENYVFIEVTDSGTGMDDETKSKIFEPFFSTKFTGRGLGLAAVLGIVKAHSGAVKVMSEKARGSTFRIFLPAGSRIDMKKNLLPAQTGLKKGKGTVLLIDDEKLVRDICTKMIETLGYKVLTAKDGAEGLKLFYSDPNVFECVILDLTMPKMDGEECLSKIREIKHNAKVIISSGYDEHDISKKFSGMNINGFIQKPYNLRALSNKLSEATGGSPK